MDLKGLWGGDEVDGVLHLVEQGQDITRITRIALGHPVGKDKAGSRLGQNPGFTAKLSRTIAFAFDDRRNGGIIGIDDFELVQLFALGQALRLVDHLTMGVAGRLQVAKQVLTLSLAELGVLDQEGFGLLSPRLYGLIQVQQVTLGLTHQFDEDFALASTLAAETSHDFLQTLIALKRLRAQGRGGSGALLADSLDDMKVFFVPCKASWHR